MIKRYVTKNIIVSGLTCWEIQIVSNLPIDKNRRSVALGTRI